MRTRTLGVVVSGVSLLVAAGCSSSSSDGGTSPGTPQPTATVTVTATPTASATASSSPSASPSPSISPTPLAAGCKSKHLKLSIGAGQGAAGSSYQPIVFTNTGSTPCSLFGYPGVSFLDTSGNQIGVAAIRAHGSKQAVTLAPGGTASALLQIPDPGVYAPAQCAPANAAELKVFPPNQTASLEVVDSTAICTTKRAASKVRPVVSGSSGE